MKNLVFIMTILFGSMLCACGGRSATTIEPSVDSIEVVADSMPSDTTYVNILVVDSDTVAVDTIR